MNEGDIAQVYRTLLRTQTLPRAEIVAYQHMLLEKLCRHARAHVPFYRDSRRLDPLFGAGDRFDMAGWSDVPVLTRAEAQRHEDALQAEAVPAEMQPLTQSATSGSTGLPLRYRATNMMRVVSEAHVARTLTWAVPKIMEKGVGRIVYSPWAAQLAGNAGRGGERHVPVPYDWPMERQIEAVIDARPDVIYTRPGLADEWLRLGGRRVFASTRILLLSREGLKPEVERRLRAALTGHLVEMYSASEIGPMAARVSPRGFRICEENVYLDDGETVDGTLQPAVVTPFYAYGTPLIRYAPGDMIAFHRGAVPTMPGLRPLGRVIGHLRTLFRRRDGVQFLPDVGVSTMAHILKYREWQFVQEDFDSYVLRVVPVGTPTERQIAELVSVHRKAVNGGDVRIEIVERIADPRAGGKAYESFVTLVEMPAA